MIWRLSAVSVFVLVRFTDNYNIKSIDWTSRLFTYLPLLFYFYCQRTFHFVPLYFYRQNEFSIWTCWRSLFSILQLENKVLRDEQIFSRHLRVSSTVKMWSKDLISETIYCYSINQQRSWFVFRPSWTAGNTWSRVHCLAPTLPEAPVGPRRTPPLLPKLCAKAAVQCSADRYFAHLISAGPIFSSWCPWFCPSHYGKMTLIHQSSIIATIATKICR